MDRPQNRIALLATTGVGLLGALALTARVLRPRGDDSLPLPGDDLVPGATIVETHQARIDAPAAEVWPWLVQMGYGRGGFYSFDLLERLAGVGITNARRIESRWQDLAVGDRMRLADDVAIVLGGRIVERGAPEALARQAGGKRTVSWIENGAERTEHTTAPTAVVRRLADRLAGPDGEIPGLQVRTPTLEDHYLDLISRHHAA